jgi:hypothetical protein
MMGQPVQEGPGQLLAAKHLWPLREAQVGSHDERLPLIALAATWKKSWAPFSEDGT